MRATLTYTDFDLDERDEICELIGRLISGNTQFSVVPLPNSIRDTRHTGWRVSYFD